MSEGATSAVELRFSYGRGDFAQASRVRMRTLRARRVPAGWMGPVPVGVVLSVVMVLAYAAMDMGSWPYRIVTAAAGGVVLAIVLRRAQANAQMKAADAGGELFARVDTAGVRLANSRGTTDYAWSGFSAWEETADGFVLLSADRRITFFLVLPIRGLSDPDAVPRLRELLGTIRR